MPVIIVGMISMFFNPQLGIFVIVLGVMLWTSSRSRRRRQEVPGMGTTVGTTDPAGGRKGAAGRPARRTG